MNNRVIVVPRVKMNVLMLVMTWLFCFPLKSSAQGSVIFGAECNSGNFWSGVLLGIPTRFINSVAYYAQGYDSDDVVGMPGYAFSLRFNSIKNDGQKMDYYGNHVFGFKGEDLFRDFEYSLKFGWQPPQIPVGFYARFGYKHENFNTRMSEGEAWTKHRINCWRPGIGIRISPLENLIDDYGWCPIIEIGSTYDRYFNYTGGYDNAKGQLNNGMSLNLAIGAKFESGAAITLTYDRQTYDLFNKDFIVNGIKPYENVTTNHYNFSVAFSWGF